MRRLAATVLLAGAACLPPEWGANAVLHPSRKPVTALPDIPYEDVSFVGEGGIVLGRPRL